MSDLSSILAQMFPGREFTSEEISALRLAALSSDDKPVRRASRYVPIGDVVIVRGVRYRCVERPDVHHVDCCLGCAFSGSTCPPYLQCSKFDRRDRTFVWFVKEGV